MTAALCRALLSRPRLSVISAEPDGDLDRMARTITPSVRVDGPRELEALLDRLLAVDGDAIIAPKTLDLLGHSTAATAQLRLGDWVVDADDPAVTVWFRELAARDVLPRLGIHAVRLLACHTASTPRARATICALAEILGLEVYGTNHLLYDAHHDAHGFLEAWTFLLVGSSELRDTNQRAAAVPPPALDLALDLATMPAAPLGPHVEPWPTRIATTSAAHEVLALIRRDAGAPMPGLAVAPSCALAMPAATAGEYHLAHVLLEGAFVRFYPGGSATPGVVYPVDDPHLLRRIVDALPAIDVSR